MERPRGGGGGDRRRSSEHHQGMNYMPQDRNQVERSRSRGARRSRSRSRSRSQPRPSYRDQISERDRRVSDYRNNDNSRPHREDRLAILSKAPAPSYLSSVVNLRRLAPVRGPGHREPGKDDSIELMRHRGPIPERGRRGGQLWEEKKRHSHTSTSSSSSSSLSSSRSSSRSSSSSSSSSSSKDSSSSESDSKKKKRKKRRTNLKVDSKKKREKRKERKRKLKEKKLKKEKEKKKKKNRKKVHRKKKRRSSSSDSENPRRCATLTGKYITTTIKSTSKEKMAAEQADYWVKGAGSKDTEYTDEVTKELSKRDLKPMTKEEWEKSRSVIRRVVSPTTGRTRLIRGEGEVVEEIVSRSRHKEINRVATLTDGNRFRTTIFHTVTKSLHQ